MPRPFRRASRCLAGACALLLPAAASAQSSAFPSSIDAQSFWPAGGPGASTTLRSSDLLRHLNVGFGLLVNYAYRPLVVRDAMRPDAGIVGGVEHLFTADFLWGVGFFDRAQLTVAVPVSIAQFGPGLTPLGLPAPMASTQGLSPTTLRDLRFEASVRILGRARTSRAEGFGLRVDLGAALPTGDERQLQGAATATFVPMLVADARWRDLTFTLNLGARVREGAVLGNISWASQFVAAGGIAYNTFFARRLTVSLDVQALLPLYASWTTPVSGMNWGGVAPAPVEGTVGARVVVDRARDLEVIASVGFPLSNSATAPTVRGILGLAYWPRGLDDDGDGIVDAQDRCPNEPEDRDGFEDGDGCPDPDNDGDHIPDVRDRCPNAPEDVDNFEDDDGCPEADNDHDGLEDAADECPNEAQGDRPDAQHPGCPVRDRDGDGVPDARDQCVEEPMGSLPDTERPGCPLPDRDHDGVADAADQCPQDPAGAHPDRFRAGCPDPDQDHDGVPNEVDRCAEQPETINGVQDDDGCPDEGDEPTHWGGAVILFDNAPRLRAAARTLPAPVVALLAQAAQRVRGHGSEVRGLTVEVVPAPGPAGATEALRLANLALEVLVAHGVERARAQAIAAPPVAASPGGAQPGARPTPAPVGELRIRLDVLRLPRR